MLPFVFPPNNYLSCTSILSESCSLYSLSPLPSNISFILLPPHKRVLNNEHLFESRGVIRRPLQPTLWNETEEQAKLPAKRRVYRGEIYICIREKVIW